MSKVRANNFTNKAGDGAPTFPHGANVTGVITATSYQGDGSALTGIDATSLKDSGGNIKVQANGSGAVVTGVLTATSFEGDGSNLTGIDATQIINGTSNVAVSAASSITFTTDGVARASIGSTGHFVPGSDSTYDIGLTGTRWRNVYADTLYGDGSNLTGVTSVCRGNLIDNGAMQIAQRGAGPVTFVDNVVEGIVTVDRFEQRAQGGWGSVAACSVEQSTDSPDGFGNSYHLNVTSAGTPTTNMVHYVRHFVEAYNVVNSGWDYTDSNSELTFSFYVKADHIATYCVNFSAPDTSSNSFVKEYTIAATNTWQRVSFQIPGNSGLTINNDNGSGLQIRWMLGVGPSYATGTDGVWNIGTNPPITSNQDNFFDTVGKDLWITGVQLEVGSVATPFEHRSYGDELARCQRYYWNVFFGDDETNNAIAQGSNYNGNSGFFNLYPPVAMRVPPTMEVSNVSNYYIAYEGGAGTGVATLSLDSTTTGNVIEFSAIIGGTTGRATILRRNNADAILRLSAEL